jgi:adenylate cyclase class 2
MSKPAHGLETEIKLAMRDAASARRLLRKAGFRVSVRRHFEKNMIFDISPGVLRSQRRLLRLRWAGNQCIFTYKGAPLAGNKHKSRKEIEMEITDGAAMQEILVELGYHPVFHYDKHRTCYRRRGGTGTVCLDETPVGVFLELEGPPDWIDVTAARLGYGVKDYILRSYASLWAAQGQVEAAAE